MYFGPHASLYELSWQHTAGTGGGSGFSQSVKKIIITRSQYLEERLSEWENNNYQANLRTVSNQCYNTTLRKSFKNLYMFMYHKNAMPILKAGVLSLFNNENANFFGE